MNRILTGRSKNMYPSRFDIPEKTTSHYAVSYTHLDVYKRQQYNESETPEQNRRVEIFMYASEQMIKNAEAGK